MEKSPNAKLVSELFETFTPEDIRRILDMYEESLIFRCERCGELDTFDENSEITLAGEYHKICVDCAEELNAEFYN